METNPTTSALSVNQLYDYAANLLVNENKRPEEAVNLLVEKGMEREKASQVVHELESQITIARKEGANKDMLYGALWCVGGIIATVADIGFIFWGAIIFGAIQFFKGMSNA